MFGAVARLLAGFYALWPSYGFAIAALTVTVYLVLLPLTLRQTRAMTQMQRLQPEVRALRDRHKGDRQRLNRETAALYQRHGVNPAAGCLPMLVQLPVLFVMYRVIRGLTYHDATGAAAPRYLDHGSSLYHALQEQGGHMVSWGLDLSTSALAPHGSPLAAFPFFVLAGLVVTVNVWLQRLSLSRVATTADRTPTQALMRITPAFVGFLAVSFPAGVTLYYLVSSLFRVGQQHLVRRLHPPTVDHEPRSVETATTPATAADAHHTWPATSSPPTPDPRRRAARSHKRPAATRRKRARRR